MKELKNLIQWIFIIVQPSWDHREKDAQFSRSLKFKEKQFFD